MRKGLLLKSIISGLILLMTLTISIAGWLSKQGMTDDIAQIGEVSVLIEAYFEYYDEFNVLQTKSADIDYIASSEGQGTFTKFGVYHVNLSNIDDPQFFENFRVNIKILSSVNTYFRIAPYEQVTLSYVANGKTVEVATTQDGYMNFNYNDTGLFYDNRLNDGFFYYKEPVKRINETTPLTINLIGAYFAGQSFPIREARYSLQMGFIIEAVQSIDGPIINWGLPITPWDEAW